jgi:hypothetical protein
VQVGTLAYRINQLSWFTRWQSLRSRLYFRHTENAGTHRRSYGAALVLKPVVVCRRLREIIVVLHQKGSCLEYVSLPPRDGPLSPTPPCMCSMAEMVQCSSLHSVCSMNPEMATIMRHLRKQLQEALVRHVWLV